MAGHHDRASGSLVTASAESASVTPLPHGLDLLSDALERVRLRGALFFVWEPFWPFATTVPDARDFCDLILPGVEQIVSYHIVTSGPCWAAVAGEAPVRLESGDVLLVPHGDAYAMSSDLADLRLHTDDSSLAFFRQMAQGELPPVVVEGGGGRQNRVICGFLGYDLRPFNPLFGALPRLVRLSVNDTGRDDPLVHLVGFALAECRGGREGARCVLLRLGELMFVEVIRRYMRSVPVDQSGWLAGLHHPIVGRALQVLHQRPGAAWTLEKLAAEVGTSRSVLAERFAHVLGQPPMEYLARWRMQIAAHRFADGAKVYAIAQEVGYESEAAFSRAFKRCVGMTPAVWRACHGGRQRPG